MGQTSSRNEIETLVNPINPQLVPFFDEDSSTFSYVARDPDSSACAIFDAVAEIDMGSVSVSYKAIELVQYFQGQFRVRSNK